MTVEYQKGGFQAEAFSMCRVVKQHGVLEGQLLFQYDWERLEGMNCNTSEKINEVKFRYVISSLFVTLAKLRDLEKLQFPHL